MHSKRNGLVRVERRRSPINKEGYSYITLIHSKNGCRIWTTVWEYGDDEPASFQKPFPLCFSYEDIAAFNRKVESERLARNAYVFSKR